MPYPRKGAKGSTSLVIGMIAFICIVISLTVVIVWIFVGGSDGELAQDSETLSANTVEPTSGDTATISDTIGILLERSGVDADVGDISADGDDPSVTVAEELNRRLPSDHVAVPISYDYVQFLPAPSIVWIAEDDVARPVVLIFADEATVSVADPETGEYRYAFSQFSRMYERAGRRALFITERGYPVEGEYDVPQERGL